MIKSHAKPKKGQALLYVALLALVCASMLALRHCQDHPAASAAATGKASGGDTIDVAIEYSPTTCYTYADTLGGFDYDLMRLIASTARRPVKFHTIVALEAALSGLDSGLYDVVVAQFPLMRSRKGKYLFTDAVYVDNQVLVQRRLPGGRLAVRSQLDLAGDTVMIVAGSPMAERIASLSREIGDTIHTVAEREYGPEQLVMMVAAGEVRYAVVNRAIAVAMAARVKGIDASVPVSMTQFQSWILRKDEGALRDSLNSWLRAAKSGGAYDALHRRYFAQ